MEELRTARALLRGWTDDDLQPFAEMCADPLVMAHFPAPLSRAESDWTVARARAHPQNYVLDGETTLYGGAVEPGQCQQLSRPQVPLPVFAAATPVPTPSPSASPLPEGSPSPSPAVVGPS